jgi:hypothetical protein
METKHTATPWVSKKVRTSIGYCYRVGAQSIVDQDHGGLCLYDDRTSLNPHKDGEQEANAEFIVRACNAHDAMYELIEQFGTAVTDMFEQMLKSGWTDDHGHDVKMNAAMIALKKPVEDAIALRAALAKAGAA